MRLMGTRNADQLDGVTQDDLIRGLQGDDLITGGDRSDRLLGGRGNDRIFGDGADLWFYSATAAPGDDTLDGGAGADQLFGGYRNDLLIGGAGFDSLVAGEGNDLLLGGGGADSLSGGRGADTLKGGCGDDWYNADDGEDYDQDIDVLVFEAPGGRAGFGHDQVAGFEPGSGQLRFVGYSEADLAEPIHTVTDLVENLYDHILYLVKWHWEFDFKDGSRVSVSLHDAVRDTSGVAPTGIPPVAGQDYVFA